MDIRNISKSLDEPVEEKDQEKLENGVTVENYSLPHKVLFPETKEKVMKILANKKQEDLDVPCKISRQSYEATIESLRKKVHILAQQLESRSRTVIQRISEIKNEREVDSILVENEFQDLKEENRKLHLVNEELRCKLEKQLIKGQESSTSQCNAVMSNSAVEVIRNLKNEILTLKHEHMTKLLDEQKLYEDQLERKNADLKLYKQGAERKIKQMEEYHAKEIKQLKSSCENTEKGLKTRADELLQELNRAYSELAQTKMSLEDKEATFVQYGRKHCENNVKEESRNLLGQNNENIPAMSNQEICALNRQLRQLRKLYENSYEHRKLEIERIKNEKQTEITLLRRKIQVCEDQIYKYQLELARIKEAESHNAKKNKEKDMTAQKTIEELKHRHELLSKENAEYAIAIARLEKEAQERSNKLTAISSQLEYFRNHDSRLRNDLHSNKRQATDFGQVQDNGNHTFSFKGASQRDGSPKAAESTIATNNTLLAQEKIEELTEEVAFMKSKLLGGALEKETRKLYELEIEKYQKLAANADKQCQIMQEEIQSLKKQYKHLHESLVGQITDSKRTEHYVQTIHQLTLELENYE